MLINLSRGFVVDIEALAEGLKSGHIGGAAIDVYPDEPASNGEFHTKLQGFANVILFRIRLWTISTLVILLML
mgnify:CR=1 FL=1